MFKFRIDESFHRGSEYEPAHSAEAVSPPAGRAADGVSANRLAQQPSAASPVGSTGVSHHSIGVLATSRAQGAAEEPLPARYISLPAGDLRPDAGHQGIGLDESGQRYLQSGNHRYAARYDTDNQTWRVIQPGEPGKPGIPVQRTADGNWRVHAEAGGPAGQPGHDAAEKGRLEQQHVQLSRTHQEGGAKKLDILRQIADKEGSLRRIDNEITSMTSTGLPDEIWGPNLSRSRLELAQVQQEIAKLRSDLAQVEQDQNAQAQQLEQVLQKLLQLGHSK